MAAGAVATIHKQTCKIVCFGDASCGRLRVDASATAGGKHDPNKQRHKSILTYKSYMFSEASLDQEKCTFKMDQKALNQWVSAHARHIWQFEDISNPLHNVRDKEMEAETERAATGGGEHNTR